MWNIYLRICSEIIFLQLLEFDASLHKLHLMFLLIFFAPTQRVGYSFELNEKGFWNNQLIKQLFIYKKNFIYLLFFRKSLIQWRTNSPLNRMDSNNYGFQRQ